MQLKVSRKALQLYGDNSRVIGRFFWAGPDRARQLIKRVAELPDAVARDTFMRTLRDFARRHRNITVILDRHLKALRERLPDMRDTIDALPTDKRNLLGVYFTHEYSIESAAFFNPSLVPAADQSGLLPGQMRCVMSVRAVGEGHLSSIVFRHIILHDNNEVTAEATSRYVSLADRIQYCHYSRDYLVKTAVEEYRVPTELAHSFFNRFGDDINHRELYDAYTAERERLHEQPEVQDQLDLLMQAADCYYEVSFGLDTDISERVLYPMIEFEYRGMEDARFVKFTHDDGQSTYYGSYCAYSGSAIRPMLIETKDFYNFIIHPVYGGGIRNKNHALFPRKINGKYAVLARIDGINNYLIYADHLQVWDDPQLIMTPKYTWEMYQIGNCGCPIETDEGWLVITHGVGTMRRYSISAALLDLDDPSQVIGRLREPLLSPLEQEREGYVPNVVYSCGSIVHNDELVIPFGISDEAAAFATVPLDALLDQIKSDSRKSSKRAQQRTTAAKDDV